jgi:hypothetical protein
MSTQSMVRAVITGAPPPQQLAPSMAIVWGSTEMETLLIHQAAKC